MAAEFYTSAALGLLVWWIDHDFCNGPALVDLDIPNAGNARRARSAPSLKQSIMSTVRRDSPRR